MANAPFWYVRLDDRFPRHPKIQGLSDAAFRLQVEGICHSHEFLTDGYVQRGFTARSKATSELEKVGLWIPSDGGWVIHDYLDWQQSKAEVEKLRQQASERGRKGAAKRWGPPDDLWPKP